MEKFLRLIDRTSDLVGRCASYLAMVLTLVICCDVFMRYVLARPTVWAYDMTIMLFGAYTMLGAAYCHYHRGHVRMDLLYARLTPRRRAIIDTVCYLCLFFPLMIILTYEVGENSIWSLLHDERASGSSWRPLLAPFKMLIAFGFLIFLAQGVVGFVRALVAAFKGGSYES